MAPLMARQPPVVCLLAAKGAIHTLNGGGQPSSSALFLPFFPLISCHLRPTGLSAPIISSPSSILIHLFRCTTTITPAAAPDLLPHRHYLHLPGGSRNLVPRSPLPVSRSPVRHASTTSNGQ